MVCLDVVRRHYYEEELRATQFNEAKMLTRRWLERQREEEKQTMPILEQSEDEDQDERETPRYGGYQ